MKEKWGVIVTDIQGDFTEWKNGSLAVPGTGEAFVRAAGDADTGSRMRVFSFSGLRTGIRRTTSPSQRTTRGGGRST